MAAAVLLSRHQASDFPDMFARRYFILAPSYHGVTLLSRLLHSHPQVVSLGDTYPDNRYDEICGCGSLVSKCAFWQDIRKQVGAERHPNSTHMLPIYPALAGGIADQQLFDHLPVAWLKRVVPRNAAATFASDYERFLAAVYSHFEDMRPHVFVDGVKSGARIKALLCAGEKIDGILHMVRDPTDFLHSSLKNSAGGIGSYSHAVRSWRRVHGHAASLRKSVPYLRIGYEALCDDPDEILGQVFRFMGVPAMTIEQLRTQPETTWHFMGNVSMLDFDWTIATKKYAASRAQRLIAGILTGRA